MLPVIEVMFSVSPNRTRSDPTKLSSPSFEWVSGRTPSTIYMKAAPESVFLITPADKRRDTCEVAKRKLKVSSSRRLRRCDVRYPTLTVPLKYCLAAAARDGIAKTSGYDETLFQNILIFFSFIVCFMEPNQFLPRCHFLCRVHTKMYLGNSFTKYDNVRCD